MAEKPIITDEQVGVAANWIADRVRESYAPNGFDPIALDDLHTYQVRRWTGRIEEDRGMLTPGLPILVERESGFPGTPPITVALRPGRVEGWLGPVEEKPTFTWPDRRDDGGSVR